MTLWRNIQHVVENTDTRADEPIEHGMISLARGIHCCPILFISFARTVPLYCEEYVCMHMCVCVCVCVCAHIWLCTYCILITVATKYHCEWHFYTNWERCEVLIGYLSIGRRTSGDWENTWRSGLQSYFPIESSSIPSYLHVFFLIAFLEEAFIRNRIFTVFINYIIIIYIN